MELPGPAPVSREHFVPVRKSVLFTLPRHKERPSGAELKELELKCETKIRKNLYETKRREAKRELDSCAERKCSYHNIFTLRITCELVPPHFRAKLQTTK